MTPADEFAAAAKTLRPSLPTVAAHTVAVRIAPLVAERIAELIDAFEELALAYPEMAHDHERASCDDYACDVMGRALDFARAINGSQR